MPKIKRKAGCKKKPLLRTISSSAGTQNQLNMEYADVLEFALKLTKRHLRASRNNPLGENSEGHVKQAFIEVVLAGQTGRVPPKKLKKMVAVSAKNTASHNEWKGEPELEMRRSVMAGVPKFVKVRF
ncbi:hypothetical protein ACRZER_005295 [Raoultella ornithinolytica]|uniref:hypothetical protein n=1 Tax=Klebsiella/Raoultella group TaxID=2890311 RepID=UPI001084237C|nr:hypothetical protein [Klebsiella pneumoniae]ELS5403961.1 hypothetical protein [Raoultella ornithinolytica]HDT5859018.1 hypothetical protein [Klebsiella quasipneumoniae subsp. similipneumoniae]EIV3916488.1 hypothetical protein [Klebsiella pneumoniae]EKZ2229026.1 hypothetical protein [Klebsiella pneumoniae]ELS5459224.1 hypothetical protein [Raoultella ornithinolytica]